MKIQIKVLNKKFYKVDKMGESYYDLPQYETFGSAGVDLKCTKDITILPGETVKVPTGLAIWIGSHNYSTHYATDGRNITSYVGLIVPRSGLGSKGLILANSVGIIDEDYQGELMISAWNRLSNYPHNEINIKAGDRIAQLLFMPIIKANFVIMDEFSNITDRANGGFGSTGE